MEVAVIVVVSHSEETCAGIGRAQVWARGDATRQCVCEIVYICPSDDEYLRGFVNFQRPTRPPLICWFENSQRLAVASKLHPTNECIYELVVTSDCKLDCMAREQVP